MHLMVTGGAGFLGQQCIASLLQAETLALEPLPEKPIRAITAFDVSEGAIRHQKLHYVTGDIADPYQLGALFHDDTAAIIHLAAVVSGSAEADFDLGMRVNVDGTRNLLQAARAWRYRVNTGQPAIRMLFSSSIAVFGGDLPPVVTDHTTPTPQGSYGIQKYIGEQLVQDYTRKGFIDGRSVRIPTVVVRPGKPNGAASGFASNIIREPLDGRSAVLPVDPSTAMWVASPGAVVSMIRRALTTAPELWGWHRAINLPGLTVTMQQEINALEAVGGKQALDLIEKRSDPAILRLVNTWAARFDTARALTMGFCADPDFESIVRDYVEDKARSVEAMARSGAVATQD